MGVRAVILVLSGLPGAGKTSFVKSLLCELKNEPSRNWTPTPTFTALENKNHNEADWKYPRCLHVKHVCYDSIIPQDVYKSRPDMPEDAPMWKIYRGGIINCVGTDICTILGSNEQHDSDNPLDGCDKESFNMCSWSTFHSKDAELTHHVHVFVIDDNMFYPSMRYEYYQLSQKYNIGFCQVHISCSIDDALKRNQMRTDSVSSETILTMATKIAPPNYSNSWEKYSLMATSDNCCDSKILTAVIELVLTAAADPVAPGQEVDHAAIAADRLVCSESLLHQADQILRKVVGQEMNRNQGMSKSDKQQRATQLNATRKFVMEELKSGTITVSVDMLNSVTDSSKDSTNCFYLLVTDSFKERLK